MSSNRKAIQGLGDESIVGITDLVAGEKDPRNLMVIFSILKVVMVEWDIAAHPEVSTSLPRLNIVLIHSRLCLNQSSATSQSPSDLPQMTRTALPPKT